MTENNDPGNNAARSAAVPPLPGAAPRAEGFHSPGVTLALAVLSVPLAFLPYLLMRLEPGSAEHMRHAAMAGAIVWCAAAAAAVLSGRQRKGLFLLFLLAPAAFGPSLADEVRVFSLGQISGLGLADYIAEEAQAMGGNEKALAKYEFALALNPWKYSIYLKRGNTNMMLNRPENGLRDFETALKLEPQKADAHFFVGRYYLYAGNLDAALPQLDEAVRLGPEAVNYYLERAKVYAYTGQAGKEKADMDKALALCPSCALNALFNQGYLCLNIGRVEAAADYFTRVAALPGAPPEAFLNRGSAYFAMKRYDEAAADCDKAVALRPDLAGAYALRAMARLRLNRQRGSLADYTKTIDITRVNSYDYLQRAAAYFHFNKKAEGRADAAKAAEMLSVMLPADSGNAGGFNERGWAYLWAGEWEKAKADFDKAIELAPGMPQPYGNLANYYWASRKDKQKALEYLELEFQRGFMQWEELASDLGDGYFLKGLNKTPEYKALVAKYHKPS